VDRGKLPHTKNIIYDFMMLFTLALLFGHTSLIFWTIVVLDSRQILLILEQQYMFYILLTYLILGMYMHIYLVFGSHKCVLKYFMGDDWDICLC
jgi:hypothetical protein